MIINILINKKFRVVYAILTICLLSSSFENRELFPTQFLDANDTIVLKTTKQKGKGLFELGFGVLEFKDTTDNFNNKVLFPQHVDSIKRFQLRVDYAKKDHFVELMIGKLKGIPIFIIDENNNKNLADDSIRNLKEIDWKQVEDLIPCEYTIFNGEKIIKDSSWLAIGSFNGRFLLGKREYLTVSFTLGDKDYEIGVSESRNPLSFSYGFYPDVALLNDAGVKKDTLLIKDLLTIGEYVNLNEQYYKIESISKLGDSIILVKEKAFNTIKGTQVGMIAPDFKAVSVLGDTIRKSDIINKKTIIANSCGCGGDSISTDAYFDMVNTFGNDVNIFHVDSNFKKLDRGTHIDSEAPINRDFYEIFRKEYCSRLCYVIGIDGRIIDKFVITDWKNNTINILD